MTTTTNRTGRHCVVCDYCGKRSRPYSGRATERRWSDDELDWIGPKNWTAAPYPGRVLHRCPACQNSPAPLLPEPLAWLKRMAG